ncbi:MAG TPA: peptide chain release factor N(5)-glutamine methyltransferase [Terriglobia bacterium]|nr:peptide chain release factor N(5)-glutamine methyltransferase [Terriglobia bacterium]
MQLRPALQTALARLEEHGVPSARLAAELLLMHVLGRDRAYLYSNPEAELDAAALDRYQRLIDERSTGRPTQYITGHQEFWGLDFEVTPDVLIPRPETEHVVEAVLDLARRADAPPAAEGALRLADVGTGSGCIALAVASELPRSTIFATDFSPAALAVARRNAARLGMSVRVRFLEGDLLAPFLDGHAVLDGQPGDDVPALHDLDFVVSNPPYVALDELDRVQREVREFEPRLAWGGLERGDEVYRRLIPQALAALKPRGWLVVEIGYNAAERVRALLGTDWTSVEVRPDLAGIPRVVVARKLQIATA